MVLCDRRVSHDDAISKALYQKERVLCWIMTTPKNLDVKARVVRDTWSRRCNKVLFMSSVTDPKFPTIGLNVSEGRRHLTAKTMQAFRYIYENHFDDADWFMKADDDTYVILENLRYFLTSQNKSEPVFFGHHFKVFVKQGFYSGGGGYVLSKQALRRYGEKGRDPSVCRQDFGPEDLEMGKCMQNLGVRTVNTLDALGRSRFHCFYPETHLFGRYPKWYYKFDANGAKKGTENISNYAISFHYVSPQKMQALEFYIYHLRPYGIVSGTKELNRQADVKPGSQELNRQVIVKPETQEVNRQADVKPGTQEVNRQADVKPGTQEVNRQADVKPGTQEVNRQAVVKPGTQDVNRQADVKPGTQEVNRQADVKPGTQEVNRQADVKPGTQEVNRQADVKPGTQEVNRQADVTPGTQELNRQADVKPGIQEVNRQANVKPGTQEVNRQAGVKPGTQEVNRQADVTLGTQEVNRQADVKPGTQEVNRQADVKPGTQEVNRQADVKPGTQKVNRHA
ncbi:glycoprotein-N-acetylgalactosamine 3-beta-galactosyltransferase 1-like [Haliotis rufescens]|uniref:glycoprotein-N-acetylgalactosamine 3-beta-galactosyltransferase 1-like n=1 Tax=Haliotis rufescens TaxID=6454 RepID=UPI00201F329A|nr:glycoprotein-N-acetylgalactosamine 3-beta-galactosyltransferase 1-like [Haliotis rufescens]